MVYISILQVPLLLHAAITDVAIRTISNRVCVAIAVIGIISLSTNLLQLAESLGVAVMLFLLLLTMHSRGWVGGGDVKLLAALTIGLSLTQLMQLLTVMALAGVGLAMAHMMLRSLSSPALAPVGSSIVRRVYAVERWRNLRHAPLPYGVAIACGGIWIFLGNEIKEAHMVANVVAVPPLEETTPSLMTRDQSSRSSTTISVRRRCAPVLKAPTWKSSEGQSATRRGCSKPTPSYSPWWRILAGSMIRSLHWKTWRGFARLMC